jgi:predicted AlkP superfamily phosphohydrolase/phosphomutase
MTVVLIGLDGATFEVIDALIATGRLPNFRQLLQDGSRAILNSTVPPVTAPAWTTLMTGVNPGKHGCFDFVSPVPGTFGQRLNTSRSIKAPTIWSLLSQQSRRVACIGMPMTNPVYPVNGVMLGGYAGPTGCVTYPAGLSAELLALGAFRLDWDYEGGHVDEVQVEHLIQQLVESCDTLDRINAHLWSKETWDVFSTTFLALDRVQHLFWRDWDTTSDPTTTHIGRVYERVDKSLGYLLEHVGDDATVILVSDHGFGRRTADFRLNQWLIETGYLSTNLASKAAVTIDWPHTKAYAARPLEYGIRINVKGREPEGSVEPGQEYEAVRQSLIRDLQSLGGIESVFDAVPREEVYSGFETQRAADVILLPKRDGITIDTGLGYSGGEPLFPLDSRWNSGWHHPRGIFIARGTRTRQPNSVHPPVQMTDITPSVLRLLAIEPPAWMDGSPLDVLFAFEPAEAVYHADARHVQPTSIAEHAVGGRGISTGVIRNLAALGYLGDDDVSELAAQAEQSGIDPHAAGWPPRIELAAKKWDLSPGDLAGARPVDVLLDLTDEPLPFRASAALEELSAISSRDVGCSVCIRVCPGQLDLLSGSVISWHHPERVLIEVVGDESVLDSETRQLIDQLSAHLAVRISKEESSDSSAAALPLSDAQTGSAPVNVRPGPLPDDDAQWVRWVRRAPSSAYLSYALDGNLATNRLCPAGASMLALAGDGTVFPCLPLARRGEWAVGSFDGQIRLSDDKKSAFHAARELDQVHHCGHCDHPAHFGLLPASGLVDLFDPREEGPPAKRAGIATLRQAVPTHLDLGSEAATIFCIHDDVSRWHTAEKHWRWSTLNSSVYLDVHHASRVLFVRFARLPQDIFGIPLHVTVFAAGQRLGTETVAGIDPDVGPNGFRLDYALPAGLLAGVVRVDLSLSRVWRPSAISDSVDQRDLGVGVAEIWTDAPEFYSYALDLLSPLSEIEQSVPGTELTVRLNVTNSGPHRWPGDRLSIATRWYRDGAFFSEGSHVPVAGDISPGASVALAAPVSVPSGSGRYRLLIDLVHEGVTWFHERADGAVWLAVAPTPTQPPA